MNVWQKCKKDQTQKLEHRKRQCPLKLYRIRPKEEYEPAPSRSVVFRHIFLEVKKKVKNENGVGMYSWRVGMKRRNARRIMIRIARRTMQNLRAEVV